MIKITKGEYEAMVKSGFKCHYPVQRSGKGNKYYYLVDNDYDNYQRYQDNRKRFANKIVETF